MHKPRRTPVATAVAAVAFALGLSMALAPGAGSTAPPERKAGTSGAKVYHQLAMKKKNYVKLDLLASTTSTATSSRPRRANILINNTKAGGAASTWPASDQERKASRAAVPHR